MEVLRITLCVETQGGEALDCGGAVPTVRRRPTAEEPVADHDRIGEVYPAVSIHLAAGRDGGTALELLPTAEEPAQKPDGIAQVDARVAVDVRARDIWTRLPVHRR